MQHSNDIPMVFTKESYMKTMGIHLLQGRDFEKFDSGKVILNEAAMNYLGITRAHAIGTRLYSERGDTHAKLNFQIVGIVKDFNFSSLHEEIKPLMFTYHQDETDLPNMIVAGETKDYKTLIAQMEQKWKKLIPGVPFEYSFLDANTPRRHRFPG
jgi:putative ABC transport system permease protein